MMPNDAKAVATLSQYGSTDWLASSRIWRVIHAGFIKVSSRPPAVTALRSGTCCSHGLGRRVSLTGTKTPEQAMKDAQREAERLLRSYK